MDFGAATHPGHMRSGNEDAFFASHEHAVFAVADGMGGHEHGEIASHLAMQAIEERAQALATATPTDLPGLLHDTVQAANLAILSQATDVDAQRRMGTTLVLGVILGDRLYFAHIGDSRLYLLRGDAFSQLTRDHSLVQTMVDRGEISADEAAIHPLRHQITRVVGGDDVISPEIASQALEPGDVLLLCTDGLSGAVAHDEIKTIVQGTATPQEKADALVQAALQAGGPDNVTALLVVYDTPRPVPAPPPAARGCMMPAWQIGLISVLLVAILLAAGALWGYSHPRYFVAADAKGVLGLYRDWPWLPMRQAQAVHHPDILPVYLTEMKPYLQSFGDIDQGIPIKEGKDAGVAFLRNCASDVASMHLEAVKPALDAGNLHLARNELSRAKELRADKTMVRQLELQIAHAEDNGPRPTP